MGTQAAQVGRAGGIVVQPGDGATFSGRDGGYTLVTKVTNDETRGAYAFQEMMVAPGFPWIPPHIHRNEDEALYVLEGECTVQVGEQVGHLQKLPCFGDWCDSIAPARSGGGACEVRQGSLIWMIA